MKILNRLTLKHLTMNKKRTIVTIIGIILSTSLLVGVGLLTSTFLEAMRLDAIKFNGSHHAYFDNLTKEQKEELELNINFANTYSYGTVGFANVPSKNNYKPYIFIASADQSFLEQETITEGRMPKTEDEIVLPEHLKSNGELFYKIGDEITLEIGPRMFDEEEIYSNNIAWCSEYKNQELVSTEKIIPKQKKTYKVVGFISRSNQEDYSAPGYMAFTTNEKTIANYRVYVSYKDVKKTYEKTSEICGLYKSATCNTNDSLLYYYGVSRYNNVNNAIVSVLLIGLTLLSVGCIIVIYNSFAISTMERKKSFGLYSSLGATPKQIKYTVFFEAFLVGTIGIVLGIMAAFLGIYVTVNILDHLVGETWGTLKFSVDFLYVFIPVCFMILVVYFSAFIPAHRSSKVSSIEMIRENDEIKIPRRKVKTPKWIRKVFGMEGEIALKNMKRNKRKYRITLLSLFISIVLFISFSTYLDLGLRITNMADYQEYDIAVYAKEKTLQEIKQNSLIEKSYQVQEKQVWYKLFDESSYSEKYYNYMMNRLDGEYGNLFAIILDDDVYNSLVEDTKTEKGNILVLNQIQFTMYEKNSRKTYQTELWNENVSALNLCSYQEEEQVCKDYSISLIREAPELLKYLPYETSSPIIFISQTMAKKDDLLSAESPYKYLTIVSKDYQKLYEELDKSYGNSNDVNIYSPKIQMEQEKNSILALKILLYGFITLVTLTGVTSVFNTIHTSIHLRKKEFAMLRSIGLSPKGFNRMIFFESLFFGLKSLFYALPVSYVFVLLINSSIGGVYSFGRVIIPWKSVFLSIMGVFLVVLITMWYSVKKIKKENILNSLRDENI